MGFWDEQLGFMYFEILDLGIYTFNDLEIQGFRDLEILVIKDDGLGNLTQS